MFDSEIMTILSRKIFGYFSSLVLI